MSAHWGGAPSSPYPPYRNHNGEDQYYYAPPSSEASRYGYHDSRSPPPPPSSVAPYYHGDRTPGAGATATMAEERRRFAVRDPYASAGTAPYDHRSSSAYHDRPPQETFPGYRNESYVRLDDGRPPPPPYGFATTTTTTTTAPSRYDDYRDGYHRSSGPPPAWAAPFLARCGDGDACGEQCSLFDNRVSNDATMRPTTFYCATNAFGRPNGAAGASCVPIPSHDGRGGGGFASGDPSASWRGR